MQPGNPERSGHEQTAPARRHFLMGMGAVAAVGAAGGIADRRQRPRSVPKPPAALDLSARGGRRPNVLLIVSDQERHWQDLPSGLGLRAHEMLLEKGTGFTRYHANTTPCSPSRSNMYFGQHTQATRMTANLDAPPTFPELADGLPSLGHLLRAQGYYTAYKGKWHLSHMARDPGLVYTSYPNTRDALEPFGFADYNIDGDPHGSTWTGYKFDGQIASNAVNWLATRGRGMRGRQPWFLAVNFVNPHDVMYFSSGARQEDSRRSRNLLSPLAPAPIGGVYDKNWEVDLPASFRQDDLSTKPWAQRSYVEFCSMLYGGMDPADPAPWHALQSYYFNCVRDVDSHALTVLQALRQLQLDGDTIVIYTADHGEMAGAHRLRQKGPHMYRENVRVPLIVRHPDVAAGRAGALTDALGSCVDLTPTVLGLIGVDARAAAEKYPYLRGVDLSPAIARPEARTERDRRGILFNYDVPLYEDPDYARLAIDAGGGPMLAMLRVALRHGRLGPSRQNPALFRGVHDGRYKFARYFRPAEHHIPSDWDTLLKHNELELYDTQADPDELVNLAREPEKQRALITALNARTNALIEREIGVDDGASLPGPRALYRL